MTVENWINASGWETWTILIKLSRKIIDVKKNERDTVLSRFCYHAFFYRIKKVRGERKISNLEKRTNVLNMCNLLTWQYKSYFVKCSQS